MAKSAHIEKICSTLRAAKSLSILLVALRAAQHGFYTSGLLHTPMWIIDIKPYKNSFLQVTNKWSCIEQNCLDIQTMHKVLSYIEWISGGQTSVIVQSNTSVL